MRISTGSEPTPAEQREFDAITHIDRRLIDVFLPRWPLLQFIRDPLIIARLITTDEEASGLATDSVIACTVSINIVSDLCPSHHLYRGYTLPFCLRVASNKTPS